MQTQDPFEVFLKLQQIYLLQQISSQLLSRGFTNKQLPQQFINICRHSNSQQQFISKCTQIVSSISQHLLISLYNTIRQKLPKKQLLKKQHDAHLQKMSHQPQKQQLDQGAKNSKNFPGLCMPNNINDEIDLDLQQFQSRNIKQQHALKQQKIKSEYNSQKHSYNRDHHSHKRKSESKESSENKKKKHKQKKKYKSKYHDRSQSESRQKQKHRYEKRSRSRQRQNKNRQYHKKQQYHVKEEKAQLQQGKVLKAVITKVIQNKGFFVKFLNVQTTIQGLVHNSQLKQEQIASNFAKEGQKVWVRVVSILDNRIRLSLKQIDQRTGKDLAKAQLESEARMNQKKQNQFGSLTGIKVYEDEQAGKEGQGSNYTQMWEMSRMKYMKGIVKTNPLNKQDIQEVNIQMNDKQPPFLRGQTTKAGINLSPVRVVKNPEGTLQREALNAVQYAKERRQIRQQQSKQGPKDLVGILDELTPRQQLKKQPARPAQTIKQQKNQLPIHAYKEQLIKACYDNKILIVIGETGSGKTTQITQYLYNEGFAKRGKIGCTQPRRVAAMSVARRVSEQMNVKLGQEVGYSIRFQDCTSHKTVIKYMTDGMLLRQALIDKYLTQYSVIMLDQAHERTIHTDVLFGILKKVIQKRNDFLLIVTSATLEAKKFSSYFFDCKIFSIPGRTYNVEILYSKEPQTDYLDASLLCVMQIHIDEPQGDILLFLTGQQQIDTACQILNERLKKFGNQVPQLIILPVYSALPSQLQTRIFEPAPKGKRKCVIATNIAQASLTIDGIYYVVDPGFAKIKIYNSKLGMDTLVVAPISQASAKQRAGRAGRTGPGKCYRIYTQEAYKVQMLPTSVPQIQRANLSNTVLQLKAMGINDLINFDFMDPPPVQTLIAALEQLYYLSALDDQGLLTKLGRKMAEFPLQPPLSKMLLTSVDLGCSEEIITIISMLSVQNIFYRPKQKQTVADQKKTKFNHFEGDHLTYLNVFDAWKNQNYSSQWCHENYIQFRSLKRAQDVKKQIVELLQRYKFRLTSCSGNNSLIRKTIVSGFFFHAARKDPKGGYRTLVDDHQVYIHPSSSLFNKQPQWVVYHELIFTTKQYMRDVCAINAKWLTDVAPNFFKFTDDIGFTRKKRNERLDPLNQKYGDPNAWRLSKRKG